VPFAPAATPASGSREQLVNGIPVAQQPSSATAGGTGSGAPGGGGAGATTSATTAASGAWPVALAAAIVALLVIAPVLLARRGLRRLVRSDHPDPSNDGWRSAGRTSGS
jgi:hypothetical protein